MKTKIALWQNRRKSIKFYQLPKQQLSKDGSGITSMLLFLPESEEYIPFALHFLKSISNSTKVKIQLMCNHEALDTYQGITGNVVIHTYSENHLNRWGLPTEGFADLLFQDPYDAVVDLNPKFNPITAYLVNKSDSPLKIGFNSELAEEYFNIIIDYNGQEFLEKSFNNVKKILGL